MLNEVGIICFSGTYLIAFGLELSRNYFKNPLRDFLLTFSIGLGLIAHCAFLYHHQFAWESGKIITSVQGFFLCVAWVLACFCLYLRLAYPRIPFGIFLWPIVLGLIVGGAFWGTSQPFSTEAVGQIWRSVHGISLMFATFSMIFSFVAGLMYFEQRRRLKNKIPPNSLWKLPSLEWTQTAARHGIGFTTFTLAIGVFSGILLNHLLFFHEEKTVSLYDPLVGGTLLLFVFLLGFLATLFLRRRTGTERQIAAITGLCFVLLVVILFWALLSGEAHWKKVTMNQTINTINKVKFNEPCAVHAG